ncbi:hypothetical protein L4C54_19100 [Vibrio lamellibrachiae]|uniref:hypothetical protein n=1 Tax=Vibrio lamellibrachiae TaxID=2910253 RepID=UPI003D0D247B
MSKKKIGLVFVALLVVSVGYLLGAQWGDYRNDPLAELSGDWYGIVEFDVNGVTTKSTIRLLLHKGDYRTSVNTQVMEVPTSTNTVFDAKLKVLSIEEGKVRFEVVYRNSNRLAHFEEKTNVTLSSISSILTLEVWDYDGQDSLLLTGYDIRGVNVAQLTKL